MAQQRIEIVGQPGLVWREPIAISQYWRQVAFARNDYKPLVLAVGEDIKCGIALRL